MVLTSGYWEAIGGFPRRSLKLHNVASPACASKIASTELKDSVLRWKVRYRGWNTVEHSCLSSPAPLPSPQSLHRCPTIVLTPASGTSSSCQCWTRHLTMRAQLWYSLLTKDYKSILWNKWFPGPTLGLSNVLGL